LFVNNGGYGATQKLSFGIPPPQKLGIPKPNGGLKAVASRESFGIKQEWSARAVPSSWEVDIKDLEMIPVDFPLEKTRREIFDDASVVAKRISDSLRILSIESEFDNKKAKAKCSTTDCVNFRIRLYAGGEDGLPVCVEVQRRCGSVASFMRSCRAILDFAEGKTVETKTKKIPPFVSKPISQMKCIAPGKPSDVERKLEAAASLDTCLEMIRSNRRDIFLLGLENLGCLTDPIKTSALTALQVSKEIMVDQESDDVREELRMMTDRDVFSMDLDHDASHSSSSAHVRQLVLQAFANSLSICCSDGCLAREISQNKWYSDNMIPSLVDEVKRADQTPNCAYVAISALNSLMSCSSLATRVAVEHGLVDAVQSAHKFGLERHELLAEEAMRCFDVVKRAG
jgi:hypothetical protein